MAKPDLKEKDLYSAICTNGHIQSSIIENIDGYTVKFCSDCGSQVLTRCNCGEVYPWVQKFLDEYKLILELQSEEINEDLQNKIYIATEKALQNKFKGNSMIILKLMFNKLSDVSKTVMISVLSNVAATETITLLTK